MTLLEFVRANDDVLTRLADLAIVGTAKNVGKTTTLNWLLERFSGERLGLTSVGRDGEEYDAVTDLPKPRVIPPMGTLVATSLTSAKRSGTNLALVAETNFRTALGRVGIYRVQSSGPVEVSGPVSTMEAAAIRARLKDLGAERVLIDGAIDRRASASGRLADVVILATGMAMLDAGGGRLAGQPHYDPTQPVTHEDAMNEVASRTAAIVRMLALPSDSKTAPASTGALLPDGKFVPWKGLTALDHGDVLVQWLPPEAETLVISGALTDDLARALLRNRRKPLTLLVPDGTHVLCSQDTFDRMAARGLLCRAAHPIHLLAVTANPTSPHLAAAEPAAFLEALRKTITLPVFDLLAHP